MGGRPKNAVLPVGPKQSDALLVCEAPSHDDLRDREPLAPRSATGRELAEMFNAAGLERDRLFFVHAVACVPNEPRRTKEMKKAIECCRPLLQHYLKQLPPQVPTLVLGPVAQVALDRKVKKIGKLRGFLDLEWSLSDAID